MVIDRDRIVAVEETTGATPDLTLAPGLIDLQVNGLADLDVADGSPADLHALGLLLASRGTTSWCPTLCSRRLDWYDGWFESHPEPAPGEIGIHLEGPFIAHPGAHPSAVLRPPDRSWLAALPARVRLVTLAPEMPGALEAIADLSRRGVVVSLGHTDASYEQAVAGAEAGARMVTHVFNGMVGLGHRDPGVVGAALTDDRLVPGLIGDGIHVHPAVMCLVVRATRALLVSDSVSTRGLEVSGGVARMADGTIAGSVITMADAVRATVAAGASLCAALVAATATPAAVVGAGDRGVLTPGGRADVVAFGPGLDIDGVWVKGLQVA